MVHIPVSPNKLCSLLKMGGWAVIATIAVAGHTAASHCFHPTYSCVSVVHAHA